MYAQIVFVFTVCLGLFAPTSCQLSEWGYRGQSVNCVKNHFLTNHVVQVAYGISRLKCVARCFTVPSCQSVNYATGLKECHLNAVQRAKATAGEYRGNAEFEYCGPDTNDEWQKTTKHLVSSPDPKATSLPTTTEVSPTTVPPETRTSPMPSTQDTTVITTSKTTTEAPTTTELIASDCDALAKHGRQSGAHVIYTTGDVAMKVYCDIDEDGGWIVIQRREDGSVDFNQDWNSYKNGFGDFESEFWLGNANIKTLTSSGTWRLRIDLLDWEGESAWAEYDSFYLSGRSYTLTVGSYSGNASDSLSYHSGSDFSTVDRDNDGGARLSCASSYMSGWWFNYCLKSNLNGVYYQTNPVEFNLGLQWDGWKDDYYSIKSSVMKIRKV
ncbi:fibrinogen-like protein 1 [Asterias rubens]|uniref:fibrinogen-like protein 1 n=1 Tax=Asterias rubens TaxID=7604 RepID=UPI001454EEAB|nr:fibrinogen-like protein 1 [Asterias rubens]